MVVSSRRYMLAVLALGGMLIGCSSDDSDDDMSGAPAGSGSAGMNGGAGMGSNAGSPSGGELEIVFSPMYSAYDGEHTYQVPAIVNGVTDAMWTASDESMVDIVPDDTTGGVLIQTLAAGTVTITASTGALSGSAELHITDATPQDRMTGSDRYNNGIPFEVPDFSDAGIMEGMGFNIDEFFDDNLACANCHGSGAEILDVEHTPQQTGGYSDEELVAIFTQGMKPPGASMRSAIPPFIYRLAHTWNVTPEEQKGIVVYLRSLEPKAQEDSIDFGGLMPPGGP